jgi:hypothetical protein
MASNDWQWDKDEVQVNSHCSSTSNHWFQVLSLISFYRLSSNLRFQSLLLSFAAKRTKSQESLFRKSRKHFIDARVVFWPDVVVRPHQQEEEEEEEAITME